MLHKETSSATVANFTDLYFQLHDYIYTEGEDVASRNGHTKEVLNFKTTLTKPVNRCTAGYSRNINIFFLMAEAIWIFKGRRDLAFLEIFNSGMRNFSDDGKYFNAAYGYRLRNYGVSGFNDFLAPQGTDQIAQILNMLEQNPSDRRVVAAIWNPEFDLGNSTSKDLACNCITMFKIRNGKLHQTIQNRSNDLNWGLTTNVYQFSFLGEVMSALLGVEYGTQTHNSQSLHLYMNDENSMSQLTTELQAEFKTGKTKFTDFYKAFENLPIEFKFKKPELPEKNKLFWVDFYLHGIISHLLKDVERPKPMYEEENAIFETELKEFCYHFWYVYALLKIYISYKIHKDLLIALNNLVYLLQTESSSQYDLSVMALNFFLVRMFQKDKNRYNEYKDQLDQLFPCYKGIPIGKL